MDVFNGHSIKRMPNWVQNGVQALLWKIEGLEDELETRNGKESPIYTDRFGGPVQYLNEYANVTFVTTTGKIRVSLRNDILYVNADNTIKVSPSSTNAIYIATER